MKWLRYCAVMLSFIIFSSSSFAGRDPIGLRSLTGSIPAQTVANLGYPTPVVYTFVSNLPFTMPTPLYIQKKNSSPAEFTIAGDTCSGHKLTPGQTCTVTINFTPTSFGTKTIQLLAEYGRNVVPFPAITTETTRGRNPLLTPTVTIPLPSSMPSGSSAPFQFTYKNNNNGIVQNVISPIANVTVNPSVGGTLSGLSSTCESAVNLAPGQTCVVNGTFTVVTENNYTISDFVQYTGSSGATVTTSISTSINVGMVMTVSTPLPATVGIGQQYNIAFTVTNTGTTVATGLLPATLTPTGGTVSSVVDNCAGTLAANASCSITATFAPTATGAVSVLATKQFNGGTVLATTSSTATNTPLLTVTASTPLPNPMGLGERDNFVFTVHNPTTGIATGLQTAVLTPTGGTLTNVVDNCGATLAAGGSCTITGTLNSATSTPCGVDISKTYDGGTLTTSTSSTCSMLVQVTPSGAWLPDLPATVGTGEPHTIAITYTNNGPGTIYGVTNPSVPGNLDFVNATCTPAVSGTGCPTTFPGTLASGLSCTVQCNNFSAINTGATSATSEFTYAGGTTSAVTTSASTASVTVVGTVAGTPLPVNTTNGVTYTLQFQFQNTGAFSINPAPINASGIPVTVDTGLANQLGTPAYSNCTTPFTAGQICLVTVTFTPTTGTSGMRTVTATYNYDASLVTVDQPTTVAFARKFTVNNYCGKDVWFSFKGGIARKGCSDKNPCASGSTCDKDANDGKGICYWENPKPSKGSLHLGPMTELKPVTAEVMLQDINPKSSTIWSGSVAGRTDCNINSGDQNNCPDHKFNLPVTTAEFTLKRDAEDHYSIQAGKGVNLSMSMGPTNTTYHADQPYNCGTPGSADASRIFKACSWMLKPPAYPNASSAMDYVWVKPGVGGACSANTCPGSEVCGLSFNEGKFAQVCGKQMGYWTANQACLLNAGEAGHYFDCQSALTQPAGEVLQDLNACTNSTTSQACVKAGNKQRAAAVQWIKSACSSVSAFAGDTANSSFTCKTEDTKAADANIKMNVTDYTISFCPEMAPRSH